MASQEVQTMEQLLEELKVTANRAEYAFLETPGDIESKRKFMLLASHIDAVVRRFQGEAA